MSASLLAILTQCVSRLDAQALSTAAHGSLRSRRVTSTTVARATGSETVHLHILSSDSVADLAHTWLNDDGQIFAIPFAAQTMDLLLPDWVSVREQLIDAEVLASRPNSDRPSCAGGHGLGSCEDSKYLCRLTTPGGARGSLTLSDGPNYTVHSDGKGPYLSGADGVRVITGAIGGLTLARRADGSPYRSFLIDLNHPVPGDTGVPLGVVVADGWPGPFTPGGGDYFVEIAAQWFTESDYTQHSLQDIAVGSMVEAHQLDLDFYIDGLHYVLQMGPQPTGHCFSDGTAIHGAGTTRGTISRPTETRWVVDLPPGSIGRLFQNHIADRYAEDRGLYYVALQYVIER